MSWKENGLRLAKGMHWMGRPVSSLSPAELVAALAIATNMQAQQREHHARERAFLQELSWRRR